MSSSNQVSEFPKLHHSFSGRVRNFNLPATASNSMMPVFEAVTNAVYAIQERFPQTWATDGVVTIEVQRANLADKDNKEKKEPEVTGYVITDNGVGLNDALFGHFRELDTEYRAAQKGRGIGRLSWLKVFNKADVISIFNRESSVSERSFTFRLSNDQPFADYIETGQPPGTSTGTIIHLDSYRDGFRSKSFIKPDDILNSLLAHFISLFAQPKRLKINLVDLGKSTNLSDYLFDSIVSDTTAIDVAINDQKSASMLHLLLPKKLAPMGNSIIYCAVDRSVMTQSISEAIGVKVLASEKHGSLIYIGLVSGEVFDEALNHERTGFDFGDLTFEEINKIFVETAKAFLSPYLEERRQKNRALLQQVLGENPLYASAIINIEAYIEDMPLNWDEARLIQDIALKRHRANKALFKQIEKISFNSASMGDAKFAEHVKRLSAELGDAEKSSLAQYIVERRWVIQLLEERRKVGTNGKHQSEAIVHEVFCPLGTTSDVLEYDDHNLWLLDDRLAYYSYVTSDRSIRSFASDTAEVTSNDLERRSEIQEIGAYSEASEPDLAIFKSPMMFRRTNTPDPVVIVEFKSPNKTSYTGAPGDNPVTQIRKYIESLQKKTCHNYDGDRITDINDKTPFHCFLIAEPSEQLYTLLRSHSIYKPTPDGNGRFAYLEDLNAYFEFIPYEQVLQNAKLRNEAFFKRLNIAKIQRQISSPEVEGGSETIELQGSAAQQA